MDIRRASVVGLKIETHWVYGALINNVWSFAGPDGAPGFNQLLCQPFVNYNMEDGFYLVVSPDMGPDWSIRLQAQILLPK